MKRNLAAVLLAFILASCAASLPYAIDYPLTRESFRSRDGVLSARVPEGWFSTTSDTLAPSLVAWLIRDDFAATLAVRELKLDRLAASRVEKEGMRLLALISAGMQQEGAKASSPEFREFELRGTKFCGYETGGGIVRKRVVVFSARGKFYECEAQPVKGTWTSADVARVFTAQQTLLWSMTF